MCGLRLAHVGAQFGINTAKPPAPGTRIADWIDMPRMATVHINDLGDVSMNSVAMYTADSENVEDAQRRLAQTLARLAFDAGNPEEIGKALRVLVESELDGLPRPGHGRTLDRWRALSSVGERDLALVKLYEGHTDALAILDELGSAAPAMSRWGVFAAEIPAFKSVIDDGREGSKPGAAVTISGAKAWCSGVRSLTHALITCSDVSGDKWLAAIALDQPGVQISTSHWHAVGMVATESADLTFERAHGWIVGASGDYLRRPGFWQGGAGIAACWYGGAVRLAKAVASAAQRSCDAHRAAHLGEIDIALTGAGACLREAAAWIDAHPRADAMRVALSTRLLVEQAATSVLTHAGRTLGAGPLCRDPSIARCMADLPVFLRQSHAERDLAALGEWHCQERSDDAKWCL